MTTAILHRANTRTRIRRFIREQGVSKAVAFATLATTALVSFATAVADLVVNRTIQFDSVGFAALVALLTGPFVLHIFVSLILQLDRSEEKLRALSIMDDLTDVYNRRFFFEQAEKELAKARRYGTVFSVLAVDIDHFKQINDKHGHLAGDAVLQAMANTCMNNLRAMDYFARVGGEEFMFLIPESDKIDVEAFARRVLLALEQTTVVYEGREIRFTVSIGVKSFDRFTRSLDNLLKAADQALYAAKRGGRNCIVVCDPVQELDTAV